MMRKELREDIKKTTALVLVAAMILSTNVTAFADEETPEQTHTHTFSYTDNENGTHTGRCTDEECGYAEEAQSHTLEYFDINDESHSVRCTLEACAYRIENEAHSYNEEGVCACGNKRVEVEVQNVPQVHAMFAAANAAEGDQSAPVETAPGEYDHVITTDGVSVTHHITYIDQGDGTHKASCNNCTLIGSEQAKKVNGYYHIIDSSTSHLFDIVDGENHKCICGAIETDEDLRKADEKEYDENTYLTEYLALKYPALNTVTSKKNRRGEEYLSQSECNSSTLETIEIGNDNGNDATSVKLRELTKNMVNFNPLTNLTNVKTIKINVEDIRVIYLPHLLETLEINNATLNIADKGTFSESEDNSESVGSKGCRALKNVSFNNVRIGVIRKGTDRYLDNYVVHINNSPNLESLNISLAFTEGTQQFTIDAGDNEYSKLTSCNITNNTEGTGRIVINTNNANSYFNKNASCEKYIISEAKFTNRYFRTYLLYCKTGADKVDKNDDKIITQDELNDIENLTITYDPHLSSYMDALHDLSDISLLTNLKTLTVQNTERRSGSYFDKIAFPNKVESITIKDANTKFSTTYTITIPASVKNFVYTNTYATDDRLAENFANIKITDSGNLQSVKLDSSNVKQIQITNNTQAVRNLSLSASGCSKLEQVLLDGKYGKGYTLSGNAAFDDCCNLKKIGKPDANNANVWTVDLAESTLFNISNCTNFGTNTSNIEINSNNSAVSIMAYGVNQLDANHTVTINNNITSQSYISLYIDNEWWATLATTINATVKTIGSSIPNFVVFPGGNILRNSPNNGENITPYDRWVDRYEVEVASLTKSGNGSDVPGTVEQKLTDYQFYVDEEIENIHVKRKIAVTDYSKIMLRVENSDGDNNTHVTINENGFGTHVAGRTKICAYWDNGVGATTRYVKIGQQDILVESRANDIGFTINNSHESGAGSKDNPIYLEKNSGILSLTAQNKYEGKYLPKDVSTIIWSFADGNTEKEISSLSTTSGGISVYRDSYADTDFTYTGSDNETHCVQSNTREFKIGGSYSKLKVIAQVPYNKVEREFDFITKSCYVQMTGPCRIALSNDTLVQSANGYGAVDITLSDCKNYDVTIKDAENYNNLLKVEKNSLASSGYTSVWTLSTNGNPATVRNMIDSMKSVTLVITADYGVHEKTVNLTSAWVPATYSDSGDSTNTEVQPDSSKPSTAGTETTTSSSSDKGKTADSGVVTYVSPEKTTISEITVENIDGSSTKVALHADGTVSETKTLAASTVFAINDTSTLTAGAPTVINSLALVVDKTGAAANSKIENITAELGATTINGNICITPQMVKGVKSAVSTQLGAKVSTSAIDIKVNTTAADGKPVSLLLSTEDLKSNASLKSYIVNPIAEGYILTDLTPVKYNRKTGLTITGLVGGFEYQLASEKEAEKIENAIYNSIKLSRDFANTVAASAGSILDMSKAISPELNAFNISRIEYSVSGKKAYIDPNTGLLVVLVNATKGTVTVSIKVTLKNGKTKTIKSKIKIS